ncbi:MAG: RHS repeat-associated core domain-containing protein [Spirochaetales bacterium]|nr:RHS repeat-associated core domain-containing protein [Spirochaetales bacterium]
MSECNALGGEVCYYFNARWYDASTGRFISEDPARDGANWHVYVGNNPLRFIDPTGLRQVEGSQAEEKEEKPEKQEPKESPEKEIEDIDPEAPQNQNDPIGVDGSRENNPNSDPGPNCNNPDAGSAEENPNVNNPETLPNEPPAADPPADGEDISGWQAYAGIEMVGVGVIVGGVGVATGNIPLAAAGGIAIVAGSDLARNSNIDKTTEKVYDISKSVNNFVNKLMGNE